MFSKLTSVRPILERTSGSTKNSDLFSIHIELNKKEKEAKEADNTYKERKQILKSLQQTIQELQKNIEEKQELLCSSELFLQDEMVEKAEQEVQKELEKRQGEMEKLKDEYTELTGRKQELQRQVQRYTMYKDFIDQGLRIMKFEDVDDLTGYFESLLHLRDQLYQKENQVQEQLYQKRKALLKMEDDHDLFCLQKNNELFQLQSELEDTNSETQIWEKKWNYIQETAAKKTLLLGQIKLAALNLYEVAGGVAEVESVDFHNTDKQLEEIKTYIQEQNGILKQYKSSLQRHTDKNRLETQQ